MDEMELLVELHRHNARLGPGDDESTLKALELSSLSALPRSTQQGLKVADVGCGTGASALLLAEYLQAHIQAVDLFPEFLETLNQRALAQGLNDLIQPLCASMESLPFEEGSLDLLWSEGAVYNMGFEAGLKAWSPFLKSGGVIALSELTWLTSTRPQALQAHWNQEYPQVDLPSSKISTLERLGFTLLGYFPLPERAWAAYYEPLKERLSAFLAQHQEKAEAHALVEAELQEIALYEAHKPYMSYGFYVAQKL